MLGKRTKAVVSFAFGGLFFSISGLSIARGCLPFRGDCVADVATHIWIIAAVSIALIVNGFIQLVGSFSEKKSGDTDGQPASARAAKTATKPAARRSPRAKSDQPDIGDAARARIEQMMRKSGAQAAVQSPPAAPHSEPSAEVSSAPAAEGSPGISKAREAEITAATRAHMAQTLREVAADDGKEPAPSSAAPPPDTGGIDDFGEIVSRFGEPALALVRPYPPPIEVSPRSRFGGLPDLPADCPWPRTVSDEDHSSANVPLHFLAQIDLGEMPWLPEAMPKAGTLLFFARVDEEMLWGGDEDPRDEGRAVYDPRNDVQVIYDPESAGVPTEPPHDMRPIMDGYCEFDREYTLDGEQQRTIYPSWPLRGYAITSVPSAGAFRRGEIPLGGAVPYQEEYRKFRARQVTAATGIPPLGPERPEPPIDFDTVKMDGVDVTIVRPEQSLDYPWVALTMALTIRAILKNPANRFPEQWQEQTRAMLAAVEAMEPAARPSGDEAAAFIAWLNALPTTSSDSDQARTRHWHAAFLRILPRVCRELAIRAGSDPVLAAALPPEVFEYQAEDHAPVYAERTRKEADGSPRLNIEIHQMFGYLPSTQAPQPVGHENICLLQLRSDYGTGLMLCDVGEAEFWIKPDDLKALAFDKVWGFTCGG